MNSAIICSFVINRLSNITIIMLVINRKGLLVNQRQAIVSFSKLVTLPLVLVVCSSIFSNFSLWCLTAIWFISCKASIFPAMAVSFRFIFSSCREQWCCFKGIRIRLCRLDKKQVVLSKVFFFSGQFYTQTD
jgi:hypothetical protein